MKSLSLTRQQLEIALQDKRWKDISLNKELLFFYVHNIPLSWWDKEDGYNALMITELKRPGDNLHAGYIELLKHWLSCKNLNISGSHLDDER